MRPGLSARALFIAALCWSTPHYAKAVPFTPDNDSQVLEQLPISPLAPAAQRLQGLRRDLAQQPQNLALAARVAGFYIEQGRSLSDPRFYGYAQAALAPWWDAAEPPLPVLILRATLRQHDHDFGAALDDLALALRVDPLNTQAWLTQAIVLQVRGEYSAAKQSCLEVLQLSTPLIAATCVSNVDSLSGQAAAGYQLLKGALVRATTADAATRLWALTALAEIAARRGQPQLAEAHFQQALGLGRHDDYLLGSYADFLLDEGRPAEVVELLKDSTRADALLLRLALAETALAAPAAAQHVEMLRDRFAAARRRGDSVHRREEGRFALHLLDQPAAALALARDNWQVQKEPADARLLLEAALSADDRAAAEPVLAFMQQTGLEDAALRRLAAQLRAEHGA